MAAVGRLVGATAACLALILVGCGHQKPDACSVTCGAGDLCPEDSTCGEDGYCHASEETYDCTTGLDWPDASPAADAERGDADPCRGEPDQVAGSDPTNMAIPDDDVAGIDRTISFEADCVTVESIQVRVEIVHPFRGDIEIRLTSPAGETGLLQASSGDANPDLFATFDVVLAAGDSADGDWVLNVRDVGPMDLGTLQFWSIGINRPAPPSP